MSDELTKQYDKLTDIMLDMIKNNNELHDLIKNKIQFPFIIFIKNHYLWLKDVEHTHECELHKCINHINEHRLLRYSDFYIF